MKFLSAEMRHVRELKGKIKVLPLLLLNVPCAKAVISRQVKTNNHTQYKHVYNTQGGVSGVIPRFHSNWYTQKGLSLYIPPKQYILYTQKVNMHVPVRACCYWQLYHYISVFHKGGSPNSDIT